jgi:hypothetical protein
MRYESGEGSRGGLCKTQEGIRGIEKQGIQEDSKQEFGGGRVQRTETALGRIS